VTEPLRVYLDEDVDVLLGRLLASRGHDSVSASELGHIAWPDERHLEAATTDGRILITHNRVDFERLAVSWHQKAQDHAGIILAVRRADTYELARRVLSVLVLYDQASWRNIVLYA
jgi:predicted nuclease of predicted toxin-antitoxin system